MSLKFPRRVSLCLVVALLLAVPRANAAAPAEPIRSVVTFGDSWSDAGTFGAIYGTTPGSSWSQLLARRYGDDQTAYLVAPKGEPARILGGLNYAQGGSRTATPAHSGDPEDTLPHSVAVQIDNHLRSVGRFRSDQLVVVWIGFNDVVAPFTDGPVVDQTAFGTGQGVSDALMAAAEANARKAAEDGAALAQKLLANGAAKIAFIDETDVGATPFLPGLSPAGLRLATKLAGIYNQELAAALPHDPRVLLVDAWAILKSAASHGFKNVTGDACANQNVQCGPADYAEPHADETYLFAGLGHLTAHGRRFVAASVEAQINQRWPSAR